MADNCFCRAPILVLLLVAGTVVAPKRPVGGALSGVDNRAAGGGNGSESNSSWVRRIGGRPRTEREKRHQDTKKMSWLDRMWSLAAKLRGTRAFALDLEAATPLEFLESSFARAHLPASWRLEELFTTPGYAARWFKSWKASLLSQVSILGANAREHAERNQLRQEAAQRKAVAVAETEEGKRLAGLEEELARLGVSRALLNETMGEKEEETARRLREAKDTQMGEYADLEEALRACTRSLLGPREIRLHSGPNAVVVDMQGLDIFEALSTVEDPTANTGGEGEDTDDYSSSRSNSTATYL